MALWRAVTSTLTVALFVFAASAAVAQIYAQDDRQASAKTPREMQFGLRLTF
jgi:hypothetical protein